MINFLTRLDNPSPYVSFLSDALAFYGGEGPLLEAIRRRPPDLILVVRRDSGEYGPRWFGRDYAEATLRWILENYRELAVVGGSPLEGDAYGMLLLERSRADGTP
jgi:hypothetical protein